MANSVALMERYAPELLDKVFARESLTETLLSDNGFKPIFLDAKTIKIPKLATTGMTNYIRGGHTGQNVRGAVSTAWETHTLNQERYSEIPLDTLDQDDSGQFILGNLAKEHYRTHIVGELDTYRFSKIAGYTSITFGNRVEEDIAENEALKKINSAIKWLTNNHVPVEKQIIYVSSTFMEVLRNSNELVKYISQDEYLKDVAFTIYSYQGRKVVEVPEDRFYTDAIFDETGYHPSANSKKINFLAVAADGVACVKKLDFAKVYDSRTGGAYLGYVGYLFTNLVYHDLFIPDNKVVGVYASVSTEGALGNAGSVLYVDVIAGTQDDNSQITRVMANPANVVYDYIALSTSATIPAIGSDASALTKVYIGVDFTPNASHNVFVLARDNKVVAVSKDFLATFP